MLADDLKKRVIVIDTSNEIAGDGDIPHPGIGSGRRMQVPRPERQHAVMIEAVENHMPEAIVIDEIGTEAEAAAARTIAERGVQLIGTAHGSALENLIKNPTLSDLVGGVQVVTLSDEEARRRRTTKTVSERRSPPTFEILVEMVDRNELIVHSDTAAAVDAILRGFSLPGEHREQAANGQIHVREIEPEPSAAFVPPQPQPVREGPLRIYPYALSRDLLERVIRSLHLDARSVGDPEQADLVIALRSRSDDQRLQKMAAANNVQLHFIKRNTANEMRRLIERVFHLLDDAAEDEAATLVEEVEAALEKGGAVTTPAATAQDAAPHNLRSWFHVSKFGAGAGPALGDLSAGRKSDFGRLTSDIGHRTSDVERRTSGQKSEVRSQKSGV